MVRPAFEHISVSEFEGLANFDFHFVGNLISIIQSFIKLVRDYVDKPQPAELESMRLELQKVCPAFTKITSKTKAVENMVDWTRVMLNYTNFARKLRVTSDSLNFINSVLPSGDFTHGKQTFLAHFESLDEYAPKYFYDALVENEFFPKISWTL